MSNFLERTSGRSPQDGLVSSRMGRTCESASVTIADRARNYLSTGKRIVSLALGEPDFGTPAAVKSAAVEAINAEKTKYTNVDGIDELKAAVARKLKRDHQLSYDPAAIIISAGAKQAIFNAMMATLDEGDQVIIPAPYWVSFPEMVRLCGGEPVIVATTESAGFKLTAEQLVSVLTPRSRLLILNSPSNPTGAIYSREELIVLGNVLADHPRVLVISDDIYEAIRWGSEPFHNLASACPELRERVVVVNGVSKSHAMTGWRIGYAAGPQTLIAAMRTVQSHTTSNPCSIAQHAAVAALAMASDELKPMVDSFQHRHDRALQELNAIRGVHCRAAAGAFFLFPNVTEAMKRLGLASDVILAERLLEDRGVAVVPGTAYGAPGYLRISVATSIDQLLWGLDQLKSFVEGSA